MSENFDYSIRDVCSRLETTNGLLTEIRDMMKVATTTHTIAKCKWCLTQLGQDYFYNGVDYFCNEKCLSIYTNLPTPNWIMNVKPADKLAKEIMLCDSETGIASDDKAIAWIKQIQKEAYEAGYAAGFDDGDKTGQIRISL